MQQPQHRALSLVVDDEAHACAALQRVLHLQGLETLVATSAEEALQLLGEHGDLRIGVVISDLCMPGMDGAEFLQRVRREWPDVGRIMLTGNATLADVSRAVNMGQAVRLLLKPCHPAELVQVVHEQLDAHQRQVGRISARRQLAQFTARERDLLACLARGDSNAEIADALHLTIDSARVSVNRVLAKLGVRDRAKAAVRALAIGVADPPRGAETVSCRK
jgi:DNA-binding NarL/FixJ family response regulator